jgi:magnesium chelatase family protein
MIRLGPIFVKRFVERRDAATKDGSMSHVIRVSTQQIQGMMQQELYCEAFVLRGLQNFSISGLPDSILRDSKDKLRALLHTFLPWDPLQRLVVHLLPPEFSKCGAHLELAIFIASAVALSEDLQNSETLRSNLEKYRFYGGLSLDGSLIETHETKTLLEADPRGIGPRDFKDVKTLLSALYESDLANHQKRSEAQKSYSQTSSMQRVQGRYNERLALLCAAILEEPTLLVGPPGVGKTYLGSWARHLLPPPQDTLTLKRIWSLATDEMTSNEAPFMNPHARAQLAEFVGYRRNNRSYPGYFSLCHQGLLLIDEFPELSRDIREVLRNVLDTREIKTLHGRHFYTWPAKFWLIATANPCACGEAHPRDLSRCRCTRSQLQKYLQRFSGPLLDRLGIQIFMERKEQECRVPQRICQILDENAPNLQNFVREQRLKLVAISKLSLSRKEHKMARLTQILKQLSLDEQSVNDFSKSWTQTFIQGEHFR